MKRWKLWLAALTPLALLTVAAAGVLVLQSGWFAGKVRERIISEMERATGGRAEIGSFRFHWRRLTAEVAGLALHGSEKPGEGPFLRADRITVGLKLVSIARKDVDIERIEIVRPAVTIVRNEDGSTNVPRPRPSRAGGRDTVGAIISLAVGEFVLHDGQWRYGHETGRFDFSGKDLKTRAYYRPGIPGYGLEVAWRQLIVRAPQAVPVEFDAELAMLLEKERLVISSGRFKTPASSAEVEGEVRLSGERGARLRIRSEIGMKDVVRPLGLPIEPAGTARFAGSLTWDGGRPFQLEGETSAEGLAVRTSRVSFTGIRGAGLVRANREEIAVEQLRASVLDGTFRGSATIRGFREFAASGTLDSLTLCRVLPRVNVKDFPWNATVAGAVEVAGRFGGAVGGQGQLTLIPAPDGIPLEGVVNASFDTGARDVVFNTSHVQTGSTRADVSGSLRQGLRVGLFSENLAELFPGFRVFGASPPDPFPLQLDRGVLQFGGLVSNVLGQVEVAGHVAAGPLLYEGLRVEEGAADFDVSRSRLRLRRLTLRQSATKILGEIEIPFEEWKLARSGPLSGFLRMEDGSIEQILRTAGKELPLAGSVSFDTRVGGTVDAPLLTARLRGSGLLVYEEKLDEIEANVRYGGGTVKVEGGRLRAGGGELRLTGDYRSDPDDWKTGEMSFEISATRFRLRQWKVVRAFREGLDGAIEGSFTGSLRLAAGEPRLSSLAGEAKVTGFSINRRVLGSARIGARTERRILLVDAESAIEQARLRANAQWSLERESFGLGEVSFRDLTFKALQDMGLFGGPQTNLPLDGAFDGEVAFSGPVLEPAKWRGLARVTRLELVPAANELAARRDLTLRNAGALVFGIEPARITIETARLVSSDTDLSLSGTLSYLRRYPWNLTLKGSVDLGMLTAFREDLEAEGRSTVEATVRGSLGDPQVNGRLEFAGAAFNLRNLPNGLENVTGAVVFGRNRATFENLTSQTGGGQFTLSGFIGLGAEEWVYRIRGRAERVRVRYPEGVSTTVNAQLDLSGTSSSSLLSGRVQVVRAAFSPRSDIGGLLQDSARIRPPAEVSNPFLRGMQFDVNIVNASNAEFVTSFTNDVEAEADLRLRGTAARPLLLGRIGVNRGEIQFFGNKYNIVQGEILFFNPAKIEPVLAVDLETRVRSYVVMMNFSGPLNKLNFSYRSDPPMQSQEIIALLTVGRAPTYAGTASVSSPADTNYFSSGGSSFVGHALTSPVSSRLERFFGVSRIKIDPQITGVDNTPETHVTVEQQLSREITLTYVTNLTRAQQQIVRLEWNFHPDWSLFALRDSNGAFGVDFVYRRRFK